MRHAGRRSSDDERHETEAERIDHNLTELLQELRIAGLGVQVLFGFLLSLPFTNKFAGLDRAERDLYRVDIVVAAIATGLLTAPVANHRILFRHHEKARILRRANAMARSVSARWASRSRGRCCWSAASSTTVWLRR